MFATTSTATFAPVAPRASRRCKKTVCAAKKQQDGGHWLAEGVAVIFTPADSHGIKWTEISPMGFSPYSSTVMPTKVSAQTRRTREEPRIAVASRRCLTATEMDPVCARAARCENWN